MHRFVVAIRSVESEAEVRPCVDDIAVSFARAVPESGSDSAAIDAADESQGIVDVAKAFARDACLLPNWSKTERFSTSARICLLRPRLRLLSTTWVSCSIRRRAPAGR